MKKNKILVLTPRFPYPVVGGDKLRIYKICEELSKNYDLTLLSLCEDKSDLLYDINDDVFETVHRIYQPKLLSYLNVLKSLIGKTPLQIAYYYNISFKKKLAELIPLHDATFSHLIRVGDYVRELPGVKILDMTDAISMNYLRIAKYSSGFSLRKYIFTFERERLYQYEKSVAKHFSLVSLISQVDRDYLFDENQKNVIVCGNGVDVYKYPFIKRTVPQNAIVKLIFIGNVNTLQNFDAVYWFSKNILPGLQSIRHFELYVVGKISEKYKKILLSFDNVIVTGLVENIAESVVDGHIGLCPVRIGAGIQNKILEYMSLGLPTITSNVGFEGLGAIPDEDILIANTIDEYRSSLLRITSDSDYYDTVAKNGVAFVNNNFSWPKQLSELTLRTERLLSK